MIIRIQRQAACGATMRKLWIEGDEKSCLNNILYI